MPSLPTLHLRYRYRHCQSLPTIANHCQPLPSTANHCQPLPLFYFLLCQLHYVSANLSSPVVASSARLSRLLPPSSAVLSSIILIISIHRYPRGSSRSLMYVSFSNSLCEHLAGRTTLPHGDPFVRSGRISGPSTRGITFKIGFGVDLALDPTLGDATTTRFGIPISASPRM